MIVICWKDIMIPIKKWEFKLSKGSYDKDKETIDC